jgi:hypothetical protein
MNTYSADPTTVSMEEESPKTLDPQLGFMGGELYFTTEDMTVYKFEFVATTNFYRISVGDRVVYSSEKKGRPSLAPNERVVKDVGREVADLVQQMADKSLKLAIVEEQSKQKAAEAAGAEKAAAKAEREAKARAEKEVKAQAEKEAKAKAAEEAKAAKAKAAEEEKAVKKAEEKPKKAEPKKAEEKPKKAEEEKPKKAEPKKDVAAVEADSDEDTSENSQEGGGGKRVKKTVIPKWHKSIVWNKYIGDTIPKAKCMCCQLTDISVTSFHCGHVTAEAAGGDCSPENLRPICANCNAAMKTMNMREYVKKFFNREL